MMTSGRWPEGKQAAIAITMDNMGEASELHRGTWPADKPVGRHYSVTEALPMMLDLLATKRVRATYFVEAFNVDIYPDAFRELQAAGHEIGFHGWQHEMWSRLDPEKERSLFQRSAEAYARIRLTPLGFRPPGGVLTAQTGDLLRQHGYIYCSPAARNAGIVDGIAILPFEWQGIDAYYYSDGFGGLRKAKGDPEEPLIPDRFVDRASNLIDRCLEEGGFTALLFHPFLEMSPDRREAMEQILDNVANDDRIWCAPGREIADWVLSNPERFADEPEFDLTSWAR